MNRILKLPNGKTPATPETPAMRDAFANSVAALRKATGTTEARIVPCRCAMTGQPFSLRFERLSPAHRFQIARIDKNEVPAGRSIPALACPAARRCRAPMTPANSTGLVSNARIAATASGLVYCNQCGETVCGGRVRPLPDGSKAFACHDGCGATGTTGPATHVRGGAGESRLAIDQSPLLPRPSAAPAALPDGFSARLPRPRRQ